MHTLDALAKNTLTRRRGSIRCNHSIRCNYATLIHTVGSRNGRPRFVHVTIS